MKSGIDEKPKEFLFFLFCKSRLSSACAYEPGVVVLLLSVTRECSLYFLFFLHDLFSSESVVYGRCGGCSSQSA